MVKKDETYFLVYDFAITKLKLKGLKLLVFSVIHSYTMGDCVYHGGQGNLAKRLGCTREYLNKIINELVEEGLIKRKAKKKHPERETSWLLCEYTTVPLKELNIDTKENEEYYRPEYNIFNDYGFSV